MSVQDTLWFFIPATIFLLLNISLAQLIGYLYSLLLSLLVIVIYGYYPLYQLRWIPGPKALPFLGNLGDMSKNGYHVFHTEMLQKYGKICKVYFGRHIQVIVADPGKE